MVSCKKGKKTNSFIDRHDLFSANVPAMNIEGADQTGSCIGLIFTLALYTIIAYITYNNLQKIKAKPAISNIRMELERDNDEIIDLTDSGFRVAFGAENLSNGMRLEDTSLIEWVPSIIEKDFDTLIET